MAPQWSALGKLMYFPGWQKCPVGVLALAYKFTDDQSEAWTERMCRFKFGPDRVENIRGAGIALASAFESVSFAKSPVAVTCAIRSQDTRVMADSPLYSLAQHLANERRYTLLSNMLSKRPHRKRHEMKGSTAEERDAEVYGVYNASVQQGIGTILVIDDFITRGATLGEIARAIRATNSAVDIYGVVLGKTERKSYWQERGETIDNSHVPPELAQAWDGATKAA